MGRISAGALSLLLVACGAVEPELAGVQAEAARLEGVQLTSVGVLGGPVWGKALLVIERPEGVGELRYPVELRGSFLGLGLEIDHDGLSAERVVPLDLPAATVAGDDLLGWYRGGSYGLSVGVGFDHHRLKNASGVSLRPALLSAGVGFLVGGEWLRIRLAEPARLERPTTETAVVDSGAPDTGAGAAEPTSGCSCSDPSGADTGAPGDTGEVGASSAAGLPSSLPLRRACGVAPWGPSAGAWLLPLAWALGRRRGRISPRGERSRG